MNSSLKRYGTSSSFHTVYLLAISKSIFSRGFWTLCCVITLAGIVYQLFLLLTDFLGSPTSTRVILKSLDAVKFPNVTICFLHRFNHTALLETEQFKQHPVLEYKLLAMFYSPYTSANYKLNLVKNQITSPPNYTGKQFLDLIEKTSFTCAQLFFQCSWEGSEIGRFNCCDFAVRRITHNGPCFTMKINKPQRLPGPTGGLTIHVRQLHPSTFISNTLFNTFQEDVSGIQLYMSIEDAMMERNMLSIPNGDRARVSLSANRRRIQTKQLKCINSGEKNRLDFFIGYTYKRCLINCIVTTVLKYCNCSMFNTFVRMPAEDFCTPHMILACFNHLTGDRGGMGGSLSTCRKGMCPAECDFWRFEAEISSSRAIADNFVPTMAAYGYSNLTTIEVFFSEISVMQTTNIDSYTRMSLLSNIGGSIGFFTGGSLVSVLHIVYFCLKYSVRKLQCCWDHELVETNAGGEKIISFNGNVAYHVSPVHSSIFPVDMIPRATLKMPRDNLS